MRFVWLVEVTLRNGTKLQGTHRTNSGESNVVVGELLDNKGEDVNKTFVTLGTVDGKGVILFNLGELVSIQLGANKE